MKKKTETRQSHDGCSKKSSSKSTPYYGNGIKSGKKTGKASETYGDGTSRWYKYTPEKRKEISRQICERKVRQKATLVEYKGGECCICGYNKFNGALDFHHVEEKGFSIGHNRGVSIDKLKKEVDKTILVCKNCHAEVHAGMHPKYPAEPPVKYGQLKVVPEARSDPAEEEVPQLELSLI